MAIAPQTGSLELSRFQGRVNHDLAKLSTNELFALTNGAELVGNRAVFAESPIIIHLAGVKAEAKPREYPESSNTFYIKTIFDSLDIGKLPKNNQISDLRDVADFAQLATQLSEKGMLTQAIILLEDGDRIDPELVDVLAQIRESGNEQQPTLLVNSTRYSYETNGLTDSLRNPILNERLADGMQFININTAGVDIIPTFNKLAMHYAGSQEAIKNRRQ